MRYVILRDDDTHGLTPTDCLERLYRPLLDRGLEVNLSVIPEVRTDARMPDGRPEGFLSFGNAGRGGTLPIGANPGLVDYLKAEGGYRVVQHGCHHDPCEFGISNRVEIVRRIEAGARRLREAGFGPSPAFVAPHDRLSRAAFLEVSARFGVISTGWFEARGIPARWWFSYAGRKLAGRPHWRAGGARLLSHPGCLLSYRRGYSGMFASVRRAVENASLTVIVTHWWEYFRDGKPDEPFIAILHEVGEWLARSPDLRVVSFADVAEGRVPLN